MENGAIRINVYCKDNFRNLKNYWLLNMHDNFKGAITFIVSSYDNKYLFTTGNDGNIFSYVWNIVVDDGSDFIDVCPITKPTVKILDIEDIDYLSIEQQKQKQYMDNEASVANNHKEQVLKIFSEYTNVFRDIIKRNKLIPDDQRLTHDQLELDKRITNDIELNIKHQFDLLQRQFAFGVEKIKLGVEKLETFFLSHIKDWTITVFGIRYKLLLLKC